MDFEKLVILRKQRIKISDLVFAGHKNGEPVNSWWCRMPYPGHPDGCPNWGNNNLCPPKMKRKDDRIRKYNYIYLVTAEFNFARYIKLRRVEHPDWTRNQVNCCLYYQSAVKKILADFIRNLADSNCFILGSGSGFKLFGKGLPSPEAIGIDVFTTMKRLGRPLERNPERKILFVSVVCSNKALKAQSRLF